MKVQCPKCEASFSDDHEKCPQCGSTGRISEIWSALAGLMIITGFFVGVLTSDPVSGQTSSFGPALFIGGFVAWAGIRVARFSGADLPTESLPF